MSRLITPSWFSSISWARNAPPSRIRDDEQGRTWREKAYEDLRNMLGRVYGDFNEAAKRGVEFENHVYRVAKLEDPYGVNASQFFKQVVAQCVGGQFQYKSKRFVEIAGEEYCVYGKLDVWFPADRTIKDIKTTGNYKGRDHYLKSMQHKMYCYINQAPSFRYVVAEFPDDTSRQISDIHMIDYEIDDPESLKEEIIERIVEDLQFLEADPELMDLFLNTYSLY